LLRYNLSEECVTISETLSILFLNLALRRNHEESEGAVIELTDVIELLDEDKTRRFPDVVTAYR